MFFFFHVCMVDLMSSISVTSRLECDYDILGYMRKESFNFTLCVKAKRDDAVYSLQVEKLPKVYVYLYFRHNYSFCVFI